MTWNTLEVSQLHHATVLPGWEILLLRFLACVYLVMVFVQEAGVAVPSTRSLNVTPSCCATQNRRRELSTGHCRGGSFTLALGLVDERGFKQDDPEEISRCKESLGEGKSEWWRRTERCKDGKGCCPAPKKHPLVFCLLNVSVGRLNFSLMQLKEATLLLHLRKQWVWLSRKEGRWQSWSVMLFPLSWLFSCSISLKKCL